MAEKTIPNPAGAYGLAPTLDGEYLEARNTDAAAIARGTVVVISYSITTGEISIAPAATGTDLDFVFGVANERIGVGKIGSVCVRGFCYVDAGAATVANGDGCIRSGTAAGKAAVVTPDATTIAGQTMGTFLAAKGSTTPYPFTNAAPVYLAKF